VPVRQVLAGLDAGAQHASDGLFPKKPLYTGDAGVEAHITADQADKPAGVRYSDKLINAVHRVG